MYLYFIQLYSISIYICQVLINISRMEIITFDKEAYDRLVETLKIFDEIANSLCLQYGLLDEPAWIDTQEVCQRLGISKRTLQTYRNQGIIPFSVIRGKAYYKIEDVREVMDNGYTRKGKNIKR